MNDPDTSAAFKIKTTPTMLEQSELVLHLINEGKENEAHQRFPLEYHFIKKYYTANIDELKSLLNRKLEIF